MYIFKNALRNISRSKGRNILMGIIVLVIAISTCVALSIREAAKDAKNDLLDSMEITAQISVDRKSLMESASSGDTSTDKDAMKDVFSNISSLSIDDMLTYAKADSVKDFYYSVTTSMNGSDTFEPIDSSSTSDSESTDSSNEVSGVPGGSQGQSAENGSGFGRMGTEGDFTLVGYSSDLAMTDFIDGTRKITDGSLFEEGTTDNVCVISDELALYNSLNVGDTFTLVNPNNEDETVTLTIVGIYENTESTATTSETMGGFSASSDSANQILMSYDALNNIIAGSEANATVTTDDSGNTTESTALRKQVSGTYVFADVASYEKFESEARAMGLADTYTISSQDLTQYESSLTPLENLSKFATYFFIVVLIIGGVILIVFNIFNIRERKYEIGVLTAIGMKKPKVGLQFITELFLITFMSIIIGTAAGAAISLPVTNALLESQVTAQEQDAQESQSNFGRESGSIGGGGPMENGSGFTAKTQDVNYISQVSSATNFTVVLELMGIGLILTFVASFAAVIFILRYEPLKILASRD